MKIGIVSDTHSRELPPQMLEDFKKVDLILHAGDFCSLDTLERLGKLAEVRAVHGNMDDHFLKNKLPRRQIVIAGGAKIGIFHGEGARDQVLAIVKKEFKDEKLDAVIFGHTHQPYNEVDNKTLYFNPGSPNDTIFAPYCSYGILEIEGNKVKGQIIKVKTKNG